MSMIKVNSSALAAKLAAVVAVCPRRTIKEALTGVRCYRAKAEDITGQPGGNMGFAATDLEIGIHVGPASDEWCLVEGAKLVECLKAFDEDEISWDELEDGLLLSGPSGQFLLPYLLKSDHPAPIHPQDDAKAQAIVNGQLFSNGVSSVEHAVASESSRMVMTGILLRLAGDSIEIHGTDGRRLASCRIPLEQTAPKSKSFYAVPKAAFRALSCALSMGKDASLLISFTPNEVLFKGKDFMIQSRLIEGRPPEIDAIWPDPKKATVRIQTSRQSMVDALKRATIMTDPSTKRANISWAEKVVIATSRDNGGTAQAFVDAAFSGAATGASYNPAYLSEWLKSAKGEEVVLSLQGPDKPLLMSAVDEESGSNLRGLIMPMT